MGDGMVATIQRAVTLEFELVPIEMVSQRRGKRAAWPRQIAMALAYELTPLSYPAIGRHFGNRDHTTVMHAVKRVHARCLVEPAAAQIVDTLRSRVMAEAAEEAA